MADRRKVGRRNLELLEQGCIVPNIEPEAAAMLERLSHDRELHHCTHAGCPKSVEWPKVFLLPPEGWAWFDGGWGNIAGGMYCDEHADLLEARFGRRERPIAPRRAPRSRRRK
jgi:hypothetical protein